MTMAGTVRPFTARDVAEVAELHRRVFRVSPEPSAELSAAYQRWLTGVFLDVPRGDRGIVSLVYRDDDGSVGGFLGAVPRRLVHNGEPIVAAVSSQLAVDERHRSRLAGVMLLRTFMSGPQDLSIADEASDGSRRLWEALGGETALLPSLAWTRPLMPWALLASYAGRRPSFRALTRAAMPIVRLADALLSRLPWSPLRVAEPTLHAEPATPEALAEHLPAIVGRALRSDLEPETLRWMLSRAAEVTRIQPEIMLLRDARGRPAGAYVHAPAPGEVDRALLVAAAPSAARATVQHLLHRAFARGAIAASGRLDRCTLPALSDGRAFFHRGKWVLVHSRRRDLVAAFERGEVLFPSLAGELALRFQPPDA
jgi:hypothetical protein